MARTSYVSVSVVGVLTALLLALCLGSPGCDGEQAPLPPKGDGADGTAVTVLEILEQNTDTFPEPFSLGDDEAVDAPFMRIGDRVELARDVADATDPEVLEQHALVLNDPKVPLAKCRVLVAHQIAYNGTGRQGTRWRYYAFAKLPASIALPGTPKGDRFEHDPGRSRVPFTVGIADVRVLGDEAGTLTIEPTDEAGKVRVRVGEDVKDLSAGKTQVLLTRQKTIHVVEKPLARDAVTWDGPGADKLPAVLRPGRDHGRITFKTELTITYVEAASVVAPAQSGEEELK